VLKPKTYCYFYSGDVDATGHQSGIDSKEFSKSIEKMFADIEEFYAKLPPKTALIITAYKCAKISDYKELEMSWKSTQNSKPHKHRPWS